MENTNAWEEYQQGLSYKNKINLLSTVDKNERFYAGKQWEGINANGLPTPVLNVTKRVIDYKINVTASDTITLQYSAEGISDKDESKQNIREAAQLLSDYSKTTWERVKMDTMNEEGLLDAALSGDMISYWYWDESIDTGNEEKGDQCGELVDNLNYFPGNTNDSEVQPQPYIIIAFRNMVSDVKKEAQANGVDEKDLLLISADTETQNQAGDRAKQELVGDDGKCIVLLKLWKVTDNNGKVRVYANKSTRSVVIRQDWDTGLTRYPVALMNWIRRKNSAHGEAEATAVIPNQIIINQSAAMLALWLKLNGYPKVLYDQTRIPSWNNSLSAAIAINGEVSGAAQYMVPAQLSSAVDGFLEKFISLTKDMLGANETALGDSSITKTAAGIIALQNETKRPLQAQKRRLYQYIEDIGLIWLDFWLSKYAEYPQRNLTVQRNGITDVQPFNAADFAKQKFKLKLDVGPSSQWSEITSIQTLDSLLNGKYITFDEYLERLPNGLIPMKQELIDGRESQDEDRKLLFELMARWLETQPPEVQAQIQSMQPEEQEAALKQMIMGGMQNGLPNMQQTNVQGPI